MAEVILRGASCAYRGSETLAVKELDLTVFDGEFLVLVGPSGCGKSTVLRMIAGLEKLSAGELLIGGKDATALTPKARDIAMVFQNYALYPHMSVAENIGFSLRNAGMKRADRVEKITAVAQMLGLSELLDRKPAELSGGQKQRVAMARAIVRKPRVFLMDEPLSNLDAKLRTQTRRQIMDLHARLKTTTLYVTHDQAEALTMGDRIAVLRDGVLQQLGTPREIYARPANMFVAGFIGSPAMNLLRFNRPDQAWGGSAAYVVGVRPENLAVVDPTACDFVPVAARVRMIENLGAESYLYAELEDSQALEILGDHGSALVARVPAATTVNVGDTVYLAPDTSQSLHLFDAETTKRL